MNPEADTSPTFLEQRPRTVRDIFFNLTMMVSLYVVLSSLIYLAFTMIDVAFPNKFSCISCAADHTYTIAYYGAITLTSYVLYAYFSWRIRHDEGMRLTHRTSVFHQVVTYLVLFVLGIAIAYAATDLITTTAYTGIVLSSFLEFIALIIVGGSIFGYHVIDLRRSGDVAHSPVALALWWVFGVVVIASIIAAFVSVGSPTLQRDHRFDEARSTDLSNLQSAIEQYAYDNDALPDSTAALQYGLYYYDPETGKPYDYSITGIDSYRLCADFSRSSADQFNTLFRKIYGHDLPGFNNATQSDFSVHGAGHTCYELNASYLTPSSHMNTSPAESTSTPRGANSYRGQLNSY